VFFTMVCCMLTFSSFPGCCSWTEITAPFFVANKSHESLSVYQKHFENNDHEPMWMFLPRVIISKGSELDLKHCVQMQLYNALEALPIDFQKLKHVKYVQEICIFTLHVCCMLTFSPPVLQGIRAPTYWRYTWLCNHAMQSSRHY
jgi:hypothetical protein